MLFTNWWPSPPYVSVTINRKPGGIFGALLEDMFVSVCGSCRNGHGKTVVNFKTNGKGDTALKVGQNDVINDIDDITEISFPVNGLVDDSAYLKEYAFLPIVKSPGVAFLTLAKKRNSRSVALYAVLNCWPLVVLSFTLAYIAGFLIWILVSLNF